MKLLRSQFENIYRGLSCGKNVNNSGIKAKMFSMMSIRVKCGVVFDRFSSRIGSKNYHQ